ncbi:MAG: 6-pyruvoyl-tetrahydropterin synthase-related protein [Anaerolineae bacterium]
MTRSHKIPKWLAGRFDLGLLVVLLLPSFLAIALLQPGLPRTADGYLHLLRVVEIDQGWRDGVFYPRWAPDMAYGYGYPIFNYFAPLLYHLTEAAHVLGLGFETSFKLVLIGSLLLAAWGTYALTRDILGARAGILAAAAYIYAPFMLREIFVRGGYAQFLAMCVMPAALWSCHRLLTRDHPLYLVTTPLLCGAVVLSHNISGMLFFPFLILFGIWTILLSRRWDKLKWAIVALVASLTLVSLFLVPALVETPLVKLDRLRQDYFDFRQHFVTLWEILSPSAVPDSSSLNPVWLLNLGTTWVALDCLGLAGLALGAVRRGHRRQVAFFGVMLVVSVFMTLPISTSLWEHVPLLAFTQFPWRFLGTAILGAAVLAGASACLWARLPWRRLEAAMVALSLLFIVMAAFVHLYAVWPPTNLEELSPSDVVRHEVRTGVLGTTSASECLPTSVVEEPSGSPLVNQYLSGGPISKLDVESLPDSARAEEIEHTAVSDEYRISTSIPFTVRLNTIHFDGWRASIDGEPVPISPSYPEGLITFQVPAGDHDIEVRFGDTPLRTVANLVSAATLLALIAAAAFLRLGARGHVAGERVVETRLSARDAGLLAACLLALLLVKEGFIDPRTSWFRKSSPPGQVLGIDHPAQVKLGDEALFLGYDLSNESVVAGGDLEVTLYWGAQRRMDEDYSAFVHLDDLRLNYISWSLSEELSPADIPTSTWTPGFYVSDPHTLSVSEETPPGVYVLRAGLHLPDTGERLAVLDERGRQLSDSIELGRVQVRRSEPVDLSETVPVGPFVFDEQMDLVGYRLANNTARPGNYFRLLLYWEGRADVSGDYTVFVHLTDEEGRVLAQGDSAPAGGIYPTWAWIPGEVVEDEHLVPLEIDVPPGTYHLAIGLYEVDTLKRLEATNSEGVSLGDRILLPATVEVLAP